MIALVSSHNGLPREILQRIGAGCCWAISIGAISPLAAMSRHNSLVRVSTSASLR
ncbi:hypothetical protein BCR41DRAFT_347158 [Lobosporangium transversale]|uniref:Uncharacterized protein n=1 Tax=Lobosporangium transversale TaxID=64571 RepID=A0A1Y2GXF6_9FUNG|nr:hypothetical protein BCR41DRAFT_347158 [Lobosporangium transversale]ORZ26970.1 hypothetical protein BCR41DRAFT_347158 [Lobosporangium transversale]|eukprot:XP_021884717.1 hypothetical protein BCR41DRAFT_347158 [Lobosporangium transversale]